ncbi:TPA: tryptophanase leader peptide, partial [Shigella flexneri]|nr:hypothetical protein [Escherichia coli]EHW3334652.1 tryptophanase leader peptide [Shigella boydii]HCR5476264.1 tryptophanase leader peptide [Shigella dysenteriae]HCR5528945.1 tryptophanase leader peptide [Shigella flexneri]HJH01033.1 tryptophanase leader peptide [Aerococcus urinaeequi]
MNILHICVTSKW